MTKLLILNEHEAAWLALAGMGGVMAGRIFRRKARSGIAKA